MKMKVRLKFFALYREIVGSGEVDKNVASGSCVKELLQRLFADYPTLKKYSNEILVSVNRNYASENTELKEGDEVAVLPPISGG